MPVGGGINDINEAAQHWQSIRTSNLIESAFATIRHRTKRSKGCLTRDGMLHVIFKLGQCAEQNWRKLCSFDYPNEVITGVKSNEGIEITEPGQIAVLTKSLKPDSTIILFRVLPFAAIITVNSL
jgi:hypothetical protein